MLLTSLLSVLFIDIKYFAPLNELAAKLSIVAVELSGAFNFIAKAYTVVDPHDVELALTVTTPLDIAAVISNISVLLELTLGPCDTYAVVPSVITTVSHMKFSFEPFCPVIT